MGAGSATFVDWFFFFQAEDGIRDVAVTGVQTCALPICRSLCAALAGRRRPWPGHQRRPGPEGRALADRRVLTGHVPGGLWLAQRWADRRPGQGAGSICGRSEEHTSELQSRLHLVCRLLLEKKKKTIYYTNNIRPPFS